MEPLLHSLGLPRSLLFTIPLCFLWTVLMGAVSLAVSPFDVRGRRQHLVARRWARGILLICGVRVRVRGFEHVDAGRHYVYVSNHQSYIDIPIVFGYLTVDFRIMAKATLFPIPFFGWHLKRTGHLPIGRTNVYADARRLLQAVNYIREGLSVVVFPEGGRSVSGALEEFRTGVFLAAVKVGAPIVPITIRGSRRVLSPRSWHIRPGRVELILDPPIATEGMGKERLEELVAQVRKIMERNYQGAPA